MLAKNIGRSAISALGRSAGAPVHGVEAGATMVVGRSRVVQPSRANSGLVERAEAADAATIASIFDS